jgi:hypothetical protein
MSKYVISTLTAPNRYAGWDKSGGVNVIERSVLVRGGAGIALRDGSNIITPNGVQTEVSDADAEFLANHPHFKEHMKGGFVKIVDSSQVPDKAAKEMATDGSRPKTGADVKADNDKATGPDATTVQAVSNAGAKK